MVHGTHMEKLQFTKTESSDMSLEGLPTGIQKHHVY